MTNFDVTLMYMTS